MTDTPIDRLRELHRRCSCWGENCGGVRPNVDANSHCAKCIVTYPCDTIAALDALEARLDAATVLIRDTDAFLEVCDLQTHGMLLSHFCIFSEPRMRVREWLAGDKEEHSDRG